MLGNIASDLDNLMSDLYHVDELDEDGDDEEEDEDDDVSLLKTRASSAGVEVAADRHTLANRHANGDRQPLANRHTNTSPGRQPGRHTHIQTSDIVSPGDTLGKDSLLSSITTTTPGGHQPT